MIPPWPTVAALAAQVAPGPPRPPLLVLGEWMPLQSYDHLVPVYRILPHTVPANTVSTPTYHRRILE